MNESDKFRLGMMDTIALAQHCHKLKSAIDEVSHQISMGWDGVRYKRELMAELKLAKQILKSRQMRLF